MDSLKEAQDQLSFVKGSMPPFTREYVTVASAYALVAVAERLDALVQLLASEREIETNRLSLFCGGKDETDTE